MTGINNFLGIWGGAASITVVIGFFGTCVYGTVRLILWLGSVVRSIDGNTIAVRELTGKTETLSTQMTRITDELRDHEHRIDLLEANGARPSRTTR